MIPPESNLFTSVNESSSSCTSCAAASVGIPYRVSHHFKSPSLLRIINDHCYSTKYLRAVQRGACLGEGNRDTFSAVAMMRIRQVADISPRSRREKSCRSHLQESRFSRERPVRATMKSVFADLAERRSKVVPRCEEIRTSLAQFLR